MVSGNGDRDSVVFSDAGVGPSLAGSPLPKVPGFTEFKQIGKGGTSTVYSAIETDLHRMVAVKVVNGDDEAANRLEREVRALGTLDHVAGIVSVHSITRTEAGQPAIIMPLFARSLRQLVKAEGPQSIDVVCGWVDQLANAIDEAHAHSIIHRDVKPENVLLDESLNAYLADFGIASLESFSSGTSTVLSISPPHAPPERLTGSSAGDKSGDIYSLASTVYFALTGIAPFGTTKSGGAAGLIDRIVNQEIVENPLIPPPVFACLQQAMAKTPTERHRSAGDFARALRRAQEIPQYQYDYSPLPFEQERQLDRDAQGQARGGNELEPHGLTIVKAKSGNDWMEVPSGPAVTDEQGSGRYSRRLRIGLLVAVFALALISAILVWTGRSTPSDTAFNDAPVILNLLVMNKTDSADLPGDFAVTVGSKNIPVAKIPQGGSTRVESPLAFKDHPTTRVIVKLPDRHEFTISQTGKTREGMRVASLVITDDWVELAGSRSMRSNSSGSTAINTERARVEAFLVDVNAKLKEADQSFNAIFEGKASVDYATIDRTVESTVAPAYLREVERISKESSRDIRSQTALITAKECALSKVQAFRKEADYDTSLSRDQNEQVQADVWKEAEKICASAAVTFKALERP